MEKRKNIIICFLIIIMIIGRQVLKQPAIHKEKVKVLYSVTDVQGNKIDFAVKPEKIISISIGTDEILLDLLPHNKMIAVSSLADDPEISNVVDKAKDIPNRIYKNSGVEAFLKLQPDLIIIPDYVNEEMIQSLRDVGLKVYVYKTPHTINEIKKCIYQLGMVTGESQNTDKLIHYMDERLRIVHIKLGEMPEAKEKKVIFMRNNGVYYSKKTSFNSVFQNAGLYDVTNELNGRNEGLLSREEIIKLRPDIFILAKWNYDNKHDVCKLAGNILKDQGYRGMPAWNNKNIIIVPGKKMFCISQYAADAVLELAKTAYPEKFN